MKIIKPYQTIGIIGGGQLGRMMAIAARAMGYKIAVLEPTDNCPCEPISDVLIKGAYNDLEAIKKLADVSDVITYEFENIDYDALNYLDKHTCLPQGSRVLQTTQHRFREKNAILAMGIPVAPTVLIENSKDLEKHVKYPSVLKTTMGGYDGKGQIVLRSAADLPAAKKLADGAECVLEEYMNYSKEISVIIARSTTGEVSVFPIAENIHVNNILHMSIVPARISDKLVNEATEYAKKIAEEMDIIGVLGIEMFVVDEKIYVNELAPRPHNSGHYSIDACVTSQFEQLVRAVCGIPLGSTRLHTPVVMVNILGDHLDKTNISNLERYLPLLKTGKIHLYGKKDAVNKRKMGHVNMLGDINSSIELINKSGIWSAANES